eukprot:5019704-Prorocentrum_lima.AAC.1
MDLHPEHVEQLNVCRPHQEPKAEPVNAQSPGELSVEIHETQGGSHEAAGTAEFSHRSDEEWVMLMKRQMNKSMNAYCLEKGL